MNVPADIAELDADIQRIASLDETDVILVTLRTDATNVQISVDCHDDIEDRARAVFPALHVEAVLLSGEPVRGTFQVHCHPSRSPPDFTPRRQWTGE